MLAIPGDDVPIRGDAFEEVLRRAVIAAVVLHLEDVDVNAAALPEPGGIERLQDVIPARVAREQDAAPRPRDASSSTTMLDRLGTVRFR